MKILIYCDYAFNFGDLSFGKKTADALKLKYPGADIHIITSALPKNDFKRKSLMTHVDKINEGADISIDYLDSYKSKFDPNDDEHIDLLVVGPVLNFSPNIVVDSLTNNDHNVPIIVMGEYDFGIGEVRTFNSFLSENGYLNVAGIPTGINPEMESQGIYLSEDILHVDKSDIVEKTHIFEQELIKTRATILLGRSVDIYANKTEVAVNYSHNNAKRVIAVHSMYVDPSNQKDVDLIMLGEHKKHDLVALTEQTPSILDKGFSRVIYHCVGEEPILLGQTEHEDGPTYRIIHTGSVSPSESIALRKISGDFAGATGDQSLSEALSGSRMVIYETESHKIQVAQGLENIADEIDPTHVLGRVIHLLNHAATEDEFIELSSSLKDSNVQMMLDEYQRVIKTKNLYQVLPCVIDDLKQKMDLKQAAREIKKSQEVISIYQRLESGMHSLTSGLSSNITHFKERYRRLFGQHQADELSKQKRIDSTLSDTDSEHSDESMDSEERISSGGRSGPQQ